MIEQNDITGEILIFSDSNDIANSQIFPPSGHKANSAEKIHLALIFFLIAASALQILYEIFDHGYEDHDEEG